MKALQRWHDMVRTQDLRDLDQLLAQDCIFFSPVVHTPQVGRELTRLYLTGALHVFNESFHYVKEVVTPQHAVLEFVCEIDGIVVNGVDIITCNTDDEITEFKVMVRPLKAMHLLHAKMKSMLEQLAPQ